MAKTKKYTTLPQIRETLNSMNLKNQLAEKLIGYLDEFDLSNFTVKFPVVIDGQQKDVYKCNKCGYVHVVNENNLSHNKCPNCGSENVVVRYGQNTKINISKNNKIEATSGGSSYYYRDYDGGKSIVLKIDDIFYIGNVSFVFSQAMDQNVFYDKDSSNDWMLKEISFLARTSSVMFFSEKHGGRTLSDSYGNSALMQLGSNNDWAIRRQFCSSFIENEDEKELAKILGAESSFSDDVNSNTSFASIVALYNDKLVKAKENKMPKTQKKDENKDVGEIPAEKLELFAKEKYIGNSPICSTSVNGNKIKYAAMCLCGNVFKGEETSNRIIDTYTSIDIVETCPCCGRKITGKVRTSNSSDVADVQVSWFEKISEKCIVKRIANIRYSIDAKTMKTEVSEPKESARIFFSPKKISTYTNYGDGWKKVRIDNVCLSRGYYYGYKPEVIANTDEELIEIINSSFLKTSGLIQAWGLGEYKDFEIEPVGSTYRNDYLIQWYKKPYLELVVKSKLKKATSDLISRDFDDNYNQKNIYEVFGINKAVFKIAREKDLPCDEIRLVQRLYELQPNFSVDLWDEIQEENLNIGRLITACQISKTSIRRMLDYLQSCYDNQCIMKQQALDIYMDYYNMAKKIGFNLNDKAIKFPNSLKKEHDKATFAYKVVEDEIKKMAFVKNSASNKKYEFSNKLFSIIIPNTPDEVITEGQKQKHCVATYVNRIEKGETCICFLRRKDDIETPYYTCEVYDGRIYQVKGYCNKYPNVNDEPELVDFIRKWGEAKNLKVEYMRH